MNRATSYAAHCRQGSIEQVGACSWGNSWLDKIVRDTSTCCLDWQVKRQILLDGMRSCVGNQKSICTFLACLSKKHLFIPMSLISLHASGWRLSTVSASAYHQSYTEICFFSWIELSIYPFFYPEAAEEKMNGTCIFLSLTDKLKLSLNSSRTR